MLEKSGVSDVHLLLRTKPHTSREQIECTHRAPAQEVALPASTS